MGRHGASSFPFLFFISFGLLITTTPLASGSCYYPDGTLAGAEYQACSNYEGAIGPCCALNRTTEISNGTSQNWTRDTCLPNGLCKNVSFQEGKTIYAYWRDQCSSPDWPGDRCPRICLEGSGRNNTMELTKCDTDKDENSTTWCCGLNNYTCCGTPEAFTLAPTMNAQPSSSSASMTTMHSSASSSITAAPSSSTSTREASNTQTSASETSNTQTSASHSTLSAGAKAGVGVGVSLGTVAIFSVLGFFLFKWRRRGASSTPIKQSHPNAPVRKIQDRIQELSAGKMAKTYELPGTYD
ncbi:uncharacterized protein ACLA_018280 [Aspergillus clavatus NRRL 1]|uniref:Uncharacterized protein n=1 Tax=Aspergillus clavatus (strain ATCC 1007 / CBS 513.65 / DSM 816 / NCTC 3887 / NRRL 1 / QM 1276 / 107) TaxID=344612 RepID=A1CNA3_ASPCL|nr:uncharacterized protein ACLA_018280 [Aspergillus clavatus NRRL 1]EAW07124.1 hypothetical protein ACLA_018280 [Aspergillus clavatus NRRL 1]